MSEVEFDVEFGSPPPQQRIPGIWNRRLEPLVQRPGEWAKIAEGPYSKIEKHRYALAHGRYDIPPGEWEFTVRKLDNGDGGLWAIYHTE